MDDHWGQVSGQLEVEMPNCARLCSITQAVTHRAPESWETPHSGLGTEGRSIWRFQSCHFSMRTDSKRTDSQSDGHPDLECSLIGLATHLWICFSTAMALSPGGAEPRSSSTPSGGAHTTLHPGHCPRSTHIHPSNLCIPRSTYSSLGSLGASVSLSNFHTPGG